MRHAAPRLFVERATSARPHFALTPVNLPAVTEICRQLDGIPLAIELAAARVNALTPQQIASYLKNRFKLLVGGKRSDLPRHQTLRALIDWSHDLLSRSERVLLRRLSVFAGGWTLEGAESVCEWGELEPGDALNLLSQLADASLVVVEEAGREGSATQQEDAPRYRLLETVREYAAEQLDNVGETETARESHLNYFFGLAAEAESKLTGAEQAHWLRTLEAEHDNLRAALKWAMDNDTRLEFAGALWRFWLMRSHFQEGRKLAEWRAGAQPEGRAHSARQSPERPGRTGDAAKRLCRSKPPAGRKPESVAGSRESGGHGGNAQQHGNRRQRAGTQRRSARFVRAKP